MTTVTVRFFGPAADATGESHAEYRLAAPATLAAAREMILARYPRLAAGASSLRFAVNQEYVDGDASLSDGDEVAVIPPVAGGAGDAVEPVRIVTEPIDLPSLVERVVRHEAGAICTFSGTVRAEGDDDTLLALEYSAYDEMAIKKMRGIRSLALEAHDVTEIAVVHRVGQLELGEASVAVAVSAPHRAAAFDACRYVIDTLKTTVPIWKKEHWSSGETSWVDPTAEPTG